MPHRYQNVRMLKSLTQNAVEQCKQLALCICSWLNWPMWNPGMQGLAVYLLKKNLCISGTMQFKPFWSRANSISLLIDHFLYTHVFYVHCFYLFFKNAGYIPHLFFQTVYHRHPLCLFVSQSYFTPFDSCVEFHHLLEFMGKLRSACSFTYFCGIPS